MRHYWLLFKQEQTILINAYNTNEDERIAGNGAADQEPTRSVMHQVYTHSWFQILLISFICFCCPGVSETPQMTPPKK